MRGALRSGPIGLLPRELEPAVASELDAMPPHGLPRMRLEGDPAGPRQQALEELKAGGFGPNRLREWLVNDLNFLALMFEQVTGSRHLSLRLDVIEDDACRRSHTDNVRFRLVTTYRSPGTGWSPPHTVQGAVPGVPIEPEQIRRMERGWVAIMRGGRDASAKPSGVLHRSPPIEGIGVARLFLAINESSRHP
ncbi:DUF1826 domain-containing protein [Microvirga makkahensis]|uniref:DUF1826 domain-containing protein n=1 Tax=Microvirga makkahensis TaxID=1128670 RepID=A0A7X3MVL8_9HYPH|nr:DUF1826 domain-containing protein [Microvirga makkahensis]MXQ14032.1 DUF1826 domain-containing protein [Microvirga makkahensis]